MTKGIVSRPLTANTIEKWRAAFATWLASVDWLARAGSFYTSQPVTSGEPIISIGRGKRRLDPLSFRDMGFADEALLHSLPWLRRPQ
jgi:hypothetical protein